MHFIISSYNLLNYERELFDLEKIGKGSNSNASEFLRLWLRNFSKNKSRY